MKQSEILQEAVERMIADGDEFRDDEYRTLEDLLHRSMIHAEDAADLFSRRFARKSPYSRKFCVKKVPIINRTPAEQLKVIRTR